MMLPSNAVNQRLRSGPLVIPIGPQPSGYPQVDGILNSVKLPVVVMRPIRFPSNSVNQRLPSGPGVMLNGTLPVVGMRNSVMLPPEVMRPMWSDSVNQRLPSGPAVMPLGKLAGENSVMMPTAAEGGRLLRLSMPTETTIAVIRAARRGRNPEIVMFVAPLCVVRLLVVT